MIDIVLSMAWTIGLMTIVYGWMRNKRWAYMTGMAIVAIAFALALIAGMDRPKKEGNVTMREMTMYDYGHGLFVYDDILYLKESTNGRCFDVRSGFEVMMSDSLTIRTILHEK